MIRLILYICFFGAGLWLGAHREKSAGHGIGMAGFQQPARNMSSIGG